MKRIFALLVLCLGMTAAASADPIRLTSGTIQANDDYLGSFSLAGSGFATDGSGLGAPIVSEFVDGLVDFSGGFGIGPVNPMNNGSVTIGGQTLLGFPTASFDVVANPIVIPPNTELRAPQLFTTPFSATGVIKLSDTFRSTNYSFTQDVVGSGTLSFIAQNIGPRFETRSMALTFSPSPSPTPEPGSLFLLGTGVVAAWQSRRFRRARS